MHNPNQGFLRFFECFHSCFGTLKLTHMTDKMLQPVFGRYQAQMETGRPFVVTADENLEY